MGQKTSQRRRLQKELPTCVGSHGGKETATSAGLLEVIAAEAFVIGTLVQPRFDYRLVLQSILKCRQNAALKHPVCQQSSILCTYMSQQKIILHEQLTELSPANDWVMSQAEHLRWIIPYKYPDPMSCLHNNFLAFKMVRIKA